MGFFARWLGSESLSGQSKRHGTAKQRFRKRLHVERLEGRELLAPVANLTAYRPVTQYIDYTRYPVAEAVETNAATGPGIRINGDDDNANGKADYLDRQATPSENDLVRVDVAGSGGSMAVSWTGPLAVWTTSTKTALVNKGATVAAGQQLWVEYVGLSHTSGAATSLTLTVTSGATRAQDQVVFHTFQTDVLAIGGRTQDPRDFGDSRLGVFTLAGTLYQQGYDVHLYSHNDVSSSGQGAAYNEASSAILKRKVNSLAMLGYSRGAGAVADLAKALQTTASLTGRYQLKYTAYIDGVTDLFAERRLPTGTQYHDNFYQRNDWLLRGDSIVGANNVNVTTTAWGKNLVHTTIDDNATLQGLIANNLKTRVAVR